MPGRHGPSVEYEDAHGWYTDYVITKVGEHSEEHHSWDVISRLANHPEERGSIGFGMPDQVTPVVGDTVRVYGDFGYRYHGQRLNGLLLWWKSADEMAEEHRAMIQKMRSDKRQQWDESGRSSCDAQYDSLSPELQARIDRLRAANPDRWDWEPYEMFICTEANKMTLWARETCPPNSTPIAHLREWNTLTTDEQREVMPEMSDSHSGNTFSCALALALLILDPDGAGSLSETLQRFPAGIAPITGQDLVTGRLGD